MITLEKTNKKTNKILEQTLASEFDTETKQRGKRKTATKTIEDTVRALDVLNLSGDLKTDTRIDRDLEILAPQIQINIEKEMQKMEKQFTMQDISIDIPNITTDISRFDVPDIEEILGGRRKQLAISPIFDMPTVRMPKIRETFYTPSLSAIEHDFSKEFDDMDKIVSTGLGLRPIPKKRKRRRKK
jgi:hypothetical protein